jgi:hypothetical protein
VEGITDGSLEVLDEVGEGGFARAARQWIGPFPGVVPRLPDGDHRPDRRWEKVAVHLRCAGTDLGRWRGHRPSGRRFCVDEIYIYRVRGGRLVAATGVEDNPARMRRLGLPA